MQANPVFKLNPITLAIVMLPMVSAPLARAADEATSSEAVSVMPEVKVTAEKKLKQAPGVSTITSEDIEKRPVANDLSEIIRTQPGVNLTGNSASGYRGNNRQIDLRGMGPENTLILIDGKPVESRQSVKYGRSGDRDTRGDTDWVPAEEVERIEVIRGPAAARYGSGAAGGVVNIITKGISDETHGSISTYYSMPQHSDEGGSERVNVNLSGPLSKTWGYRIYANYNKTDSDSSDINVDHTSSGATQAAGREGVKNKDINTLFRWTPTEGQVFDFNYTLSRQGNIYAGDTQTGASAASSIAPTTTNTYAYNYLGKETNIMLRNVFSLEHRGDWDFGTTKTYFQYERTDNTRLDQGFSGRYDGNIDGSTWSTSELNAYTAHSEVNLPIERWLPQVLTMGVEWKYENLDDPGTFSSSTLSSYSSTLSGLGYPSTVQSTNSETTGSIFAEDNIELSKQWSLIPGVRFDAMSSYGTNWSPSLNSSYKLTPEWTVKGGIARAFKAPNLYQSNPSYLYASSGNGCTLSGGCYILGNKDLKPETSVNKELGIDWKKNGWNAGVTWFRNDYRNKIVAGTDPIGSITASNYYGGSSTYYVYQWENVSRAIVEGYEGNLQIPVNKVLNWNNNFTFMRRNDDQNGQPLSVIPKYTVNSSLDWQYSDKISYMFTATFYGKQKPRTTAYNTGTAESGSSLNEVDPYHLFGASVGYKYNKYLKLRAGINNLLDKRIYREGNGQTAGAATYNEAGRTYYVSMTASF